MKIKKLVLLAGLLCCFSSSAFAQGIIANRSALNALLGSNRADEGFETPRISPGGGTGGPGELSATNESWGTGLVIPGITFTADPGNYMIWWNGNNSGAGNTQTIMANGFLKLDFWNPSSAFGLDLRDYQGNVGLAGISVYGADKTTLLYQDNLFAITDPANGNFFGFQNPGGIGAVIFFVTQPGPNYTFKSPAIDNLAFSTVAVPEPSVISLALLGLGALAFCFRKM